jgi:hypothetical protein
MNEEEIMKNKFVIMLLAAAFVSGFISAVGVGNRNAVDAAMPSAISGTGNVAVRDTRIVLFDNNISYVYVPENNAGNGCFAELCNDEFRLEEIKAKKENFNVPGCASGDVIYVKRVLTEEAPVEVCSRAGTITFTSVYVPQATITVTVAEDGTETSSTVFENGKRFDFNLDTWIEEVDETEFLYDLVEAEVGNQSSLSRRLVADCVLNQRDSAKYPDDIKGVILSPGNFSVVSNGSIFAKIPQESTKECVDTELESRIDYAVMYFRTKHFHTFGVPYEQVGDSYFSKAEADDASQWSENGEQ